jgi:hypothetical protein
MAETITLDEIKQNKAAAGIPDLILTSYVTLLTQADSCLDANSVDADIQKALKLNAVWHLIELQFRSGVDSERSPTGSSRKYTQQQGLSGTSYGQVLQTMDQYGCVTGIIGKSGRTMYLRSVG